MGKIIFVFLVAGCFLLGGIAVSAAPIRSNEITQLPDSSSSKYPDIAVAKIKSSLVPGSVIGAHYDGMLKVQTSTHFAEGVSEQLEDQYKKIVAEELRNSGYGASEPAGLFDSDEPVKARFLIGGTITTSYLNSFGPFAGDYTESDVEIRWEIFDKEIRKTIYTGTSTGVSKMNGMSTQVSYLAFRMSIRNFLSDPKLIAALRNAASGPSEKTDTVRTMKIKERKQK